MYKVYYIHIFYVHTKGLLCNILFMVLLYYFFLRLSPCNENHILKLDENKERSKIKVQSNVACDGAVLNLMYCKCLNFFSVSLISSVVKRFIYSSVV
jgi:hypothetical protein